MVDIPDEVAQDAWRLWAARGVNRLKSSDTNLPSEASATPFVLSQGNLSLSSSGERRTTSQPNSLK